ncbi:MAG: hypothetical protein ACI9EK_001228 [Psychroserpens sp.]|jgi:hypothetical protein
MKNYSFFNKKEENLVFGQYSSFIIWLYLAAELISELFITKEATYSVDTLALIFLISLFFFALSCYFKVKHAVYLNFRALKLVRHIELRKSLFMVKKIAIFEELLKANFINISILILTTVSHIHIYQNLHINSLILLIAIAIQIFCFGKLIILKSHQATLYFPELKMAHQQAIDEQKALAEAEKHLPWLKKTF